jgi:hypothetical protein
MKEFIETMRANLDALGELTEVVLNAGSPLCIVAELSFPLCALLFSRGASQQGSSIAHLLQNDIRRIAGRRSRVSIGS